MEYGPKNNPRHILENQSFFGKAVFFWKISQFLENQPIFEKISPFSFLPGPSENLPKALPNTSQDIPKKVKKWPRHDRESNPVPLDLVSGSQPTGLIPHHQYPSKEFYASKRSSFFVQNNHSSLRSSFFVQNNHSSLRSSYFVVKLKVFRKSSFKMSILLCVFEGRYQNLL